MKIRNNVKLLSLLLALLLALSMMVTGCGGSGEDDGTGSEDPVVAGEDEVSGEEENVGEEGELEGEDADGPQLSTWEPMRGGKPVTYFLNSSVTYNYRSDEDVAAKMADIKELDDPSDVNVSGSYYTIDGLVDEE
ncbi:MAG: hypothetical protein IJE87_03860, partial [Firmicutes bacterium]|nr:hypothetical protein [Bacillota bacterium]